MRRSRHEYWQRPDPAAIRSLLSSRAALEHAEPPATATESKLRAFDLGREERIPAAATTQNLLTFWELWEAMGERGGFYVRKPHWREAHRFLVAAVTDHSDGSGQKVVLGRYCEGAHGARASRLTKELEMRCWLFGGVTQQRRDEDGFAP